MSGRRIGDETVELEGEAIASTAKAVKVSFTNGPEIWVPKSQILERNPNTDDTETFVIKEWFAKKENLC